MIKIKIMRTIFMIIYLYRALTSKSKNKTETETNKEYKDFNGFSLSGIADGNLKSKAV